MPWVRFDDQYTIHRKVEGLSDAEYRLNNDAIHWCARNLTDGVIRARELQQVMKRAAAGRHTAVLVERGLWHEAGHPCTSEKCPPGGPDGWVIHDYWDYQFTRAQIEAERVAKKERQRRWRDKKSGRRAGDASTAGDVDARGDAHVDASVTPAPTPTPPRPEGKRGGDLPEATADRRQAADAAAESREPHPPPRPARPPDLTDVRAQLQAASRKLRAGPGRRSGAFDELRAATDPAPEQETA